MYNTLENQNVKCLNGSFEPSFAKDLVLKMLDDQINFYKLQHLSNWTHNHDCQDQIHQKINQLSSKKKDLLNVLNTAKSSGCNVNLTFDMGMSLAASAH